MASQDLPAPATLPGAGESRWPMALAVLATAGLRAALPSELRNGDARWAFGAGRSWLAMCQLTSR